MRDAMSHAVRLTLISLVATVLLTGPLAVYAIWRIRAVDEQWSAAAEPVTGLVVRDGLGRHDDGVEVTWIDDRGAEHLSYFTVEDTDKYVKDRPFKLYYNLQQPDGKVFAGYEHEDDVDADYYALLFAVLLAISLSMVGWATWWMLGRLASARPAVPGRVSAWRDVDGRPWLEIRSATGSQTTAWQRVSWEPGIELLDEGQILEVRGRLAGRRRVAVVAPDGQVLMPRSWLRRSQPTGLRPWEPVLRLSARLPRFWWGAMLADLSAVSCGAALLLVVGGEDGGFEGSVIVVVLLLIVVLNTAAAAGTRPTDGFPRLPWRR